VKRLVAALLIGALPIAAVAADKAAKPRAAKVTRADFTKDGDPNVSSSGVLVFDPNTGQTL
jgi:hypothetical protein